MKVINWEANRYYFPGDTQPQDLEQLSRLGKVMKIGHRWVLYSQISHEHTMEAIQAINRPETKEEEKTVAPADTPVLRERMRIKCVGEGRTQEEMDALTRTYPDALEIDLLDFLRITVYFHPNNIAEAEFLCAYLVRKVYVPREFQIVRFFFRYFGRHIGSLVAALVATFFKD